MFVKKFIFSLLIILMCFLSLCSCQTKDEKFLDSLLKNYKYVFTDAFEECDKIVSNILNNKKEFLSDLYEVLQDDKDDLLVLTDKKHYLDKDFVPKDLILLTKNSDYNLNKDGMELRLPVEKVLRKMAIDAKNQGYKLLVSSCYRSYDYQKKVYERNVRQLGQKEADRVSAKPGTSQHQLGVAIDFGSITDEFAETATGKWLAANAANYGFSLSFPKDYEEVTGYIWECWHYRYVGVKAVEFQKKWFNNIQQYMIEFIYAWKNNYLS